MSSHVNFVGSLNKVFSTHRFYIFLKFFQSKFTVNYFVDGVQGYNIKFFGALYIILCKSRIRDSEMSLVFFYY